MSLKVFLSYSIQDTAFAELVKAKIKELLPHHNVEATEVFDVRSDLEVGADIRQSIKSAIEAASTVVVVSSESSDLSPSVNYEVGLADALGKELVFVEQKGAADSALHRRFVESARIIKVENG
ncbi:MAG: TIR domain-containing protein [Pseudomonadota bacterium]